jgi:signal transduction histidine kinase
VILLLVAAAVVSGLALATWQAQRRQAAATDAFLRGHANLVSQRLASRMAAEVYVAANAVFRRVGAGPTGRSVAADVPLARLVEAIEEVARCRCAPALRADFAFRVDLAGEAIRVAGPVEPSPAARRRLAQAVGRHVRLLEVERNWDFALLPAFDEGRAFIVAAPVRAGQGGAEVVLGFAVDTALVRRQLVGPSLRNTEPLPGVVGGVWQERPVWVRVAGGDRSAPVYQDSAWAASAQPDRLIGRATLGPLFGSLHVETILVPEARRQLTASFPSLPVLLLVALTIATAVAFGVAFRFVRRTQELAAQRWTFTSSVSHELRTPLTQILLYAETLALDRPASAVARRRAVETIVREARRLLGLVQNLLQHARAERPGSGRRPLPLPLGPVVHQVLADYELLARERGARVTFTDASGGAPGRVGADEARQVIVNLLDNAVRHGPRDQHITLGLARERGWVVLTVDDAGPGIPREDRERIWEPYERVTRESGVPATGSGLGLAVVRSLVTGNGGWVRVEDAPGGGARFSVGWPLGEHLGSAEAPPATDVA